VWSITAATGKGTCICTGAGAGVACSGNTSARERERERSVCVYLLPPGGISVYGLMDEHNIFLEHGPREMTTRAHEYAPDFLFRKLRKLGGVEGNFGGGRGVIGQGKEVPPMVSEAASGDGAGVAVGEVGVGG
jgi:hypothetical protein